MGRRGFRFVALGRWGVDSEGAGGLIAREVLSGGFGQVDGAGLGAGRRVRSPSWGTSLVLGSPVFWSPTMGALCAGVIVGLVPSRAIRLASGGDFGSGFPNQAMFRASGDVICSRWSRCTRTLRLRAVRRGRLGVEAVREAGEGDVVGSADRRREMPGRTSQIGESSPTFVRTNVLEWAHATAP